MKVHSKKIMLIMCIFVLVLLSGGKTYAANKKIGSGSISKSVAANNGKTTKVTKEYNYPDTKEEYVKALAHSLGINTTTRIFLLLE